MTFRIPHIAITGEELGESYSVRELALWIQLKKHYANSRIYSVTYRGISKRVGWGLNKTARYIKRFNELGWIEYDRNTIKCLKATDIFFIDKKYRNITVKLNCKSEHEKDVIRAINLELLKNKKRQHDFKVELLNNCIIPRKGQYKAVKTFRRLKYNTEEINTSKAVDTKFSISYHGLSNVFRTSKSSAFYIMKDLAANNISVKSTHKLLIEKKVNKGVAENKNYRKYCKYTGKNSTNYTYIDSKGNCYQVLPNSYVINSMLNNTAIPSSINCV